MIIFTKPLDRNLRIGGTDVSTIIGKNEFAIKEHGSAEAAIEDLLLIKSGQKEDTFKGNKFTESGLLFEDAVVKWYEQETGESVMVPPKEVEDDLLPGHTVVHPEYPFLVGSPDGLVRLNKRYSVENHPQGLRVGAIKWGFEAKTAHFFSKKKWDGLPNKVPEQYYIQCQYYMALTGLERWDLAVAHLGTADRDVHIFKSDPFLQEEMIMSSVAFWKKVDKARKELKRKGSKSEKKRTTKVARE